MPLPVNVTLGQTITPQWGNDTTDTLETHDSRLGSVETRATNVEARAANLEARASNLERSMHWAGIAYTPVTIGDFQFPYLNISGVSVGGTLFSHVSATAIQLTRTASISTHTMLGVAPQGGGGGYACLAIIVNGAIATSTRQYLPAGTHSHLSTAVTWVWGAGTTLQVQFGAVYSTGMTITEIVPSLNCYEVGIP